MSNNTQPSREQGRAIHRRETRRQMWLPLLMGIIAVVMPVALIAVQRDSIWRTRAAAMGDFLYTLLRGLPLLLCAFGLYVVVMIGIIAMNKLHRRTQSPLERVEAVANNLADRIEAVSTAVNTRTTNWSTRLEHVMVFFDMFNKTHGGQNHDKSEDK